MNFFMGLPMGDDVMSNYQSSSFHDVAATRELMGLRPTPKLEAWMDERGPMAQGRLAQAEGDPRRLL